MSGVICYNAPSTITVILAVFLIFATFVSYVPQGVSIFQARSSAGLSYLSLSTGLLSGLLTFINTGVLNWDKILCCQHANLHPSQCIANNLVTQQVAVGPLCLAIVYLFFLAYFDHNPSDAQTLEDKLSEYFWALLCFSGSIVISILIGTVAFVLYYGDFLTGTQVFTYAKVIGIASAVLVFFQWAPQIYVTWKISNGGALSLAMLFLQAPGSFLVVGFQISAGSDWTSWVPYGVAGCEQLVLILLLIYFKWRDRNNSVLDEVKLGPEDSICQLTDDPEKRKLFV